jgi:hypothetical protein
MIDKIQPENVEYFKYMGSMIANYASCTRKMNSRNAVAKASFN